MKKVAIIRTLSLFLTFALCLSFLGVFTAFAAHDVHALATEGEPGVLSVRALTDMGWWGQRVTGVILEFSETVDATNLLIEDFKVRDTAFNPYFDSGSYSDPSFMRDQQVVDVFTVSDPALLLNSVRPAAPGKYVVVKVEPNFNGGTKVSISGGMMANPNQPTEITVGKNIYSTSGTVLAVGSNVPLTLTGPASVNRGVDQFIHGYVENPTVGLPLNYHYRLPANYDPAKKYPLVVYFNGNGQGYFAAANNLGGQLICDGTPQFWFGEMDVPCGEDVIFLAPQNTRTGQTTQIQAQQSAELIENFSKKFAVDTRRIYGYTLSAGSGLGWWLLENRSDLFAGFIHTGFMANTQAQANAIAAAVPPVPIRLFQGQYDHLFGSANAIASYQRIVDAYTAKGYTPAQIDELIKITVLPDSAYEAQGPGLHTPSGPYARLNPNLPGPRIDRHAPMVPAFQNPATSQWLLSQVKPLTEGATAKKDSSSPTGYTVTFVYYNPRATAVRLAGDLTLAENYVTGTTGRRQPENWEQGWYHAGGTEFLRDMVKDEDGYWSVSLPLHAGGLSYWYRVDGDPQLSTQTNARIWDPAGEHPRPESDIGVGYTPWRSDRNDVLGAVYVPYDPVKQNDPELESRATYELPRSKVSERGTVRYIPYTTSTGVASALGVYLPAGYDENRAQPYPVMYAGHGFNGDETDYMIPGNVPNMIDNMVARGELEPTIVVTMSSMPISGGTAPNNNRSQNLVNVILPLIESKYNVSREPGGRAVGGFSMGSSDTYNVLRAYPNVFGYYALFCGSTVTTAVAREIAAAARTAGADMPFIFMGRGTNEGSLANWITSQQSCATVGIPAAAHYAIGAHDMTTAGRLFGIFAKNYLWKAHRVEGATVNPDPTSPTGYTVTFVYRNENATAVRLAGDLTLRDVGDTSTRWYQPEEWKTGRYHVGGTEFLRNMTYVGNGYWTVTIPLHAGGLSYWYRVDDPTQSWTNKRIWDPTATHPRPAGSTTYRVNNNDVLGAVYVPYDAKQNDPALENRAAYELPVVDAAKCGSVEYVEYTNVLGNSGWYLGVYLPAGYDANRAEPYKVMYLAHGIFGDETDWMVPGNAPNILDNMIAKGEIEPTVLVTMGNHFSPGGGMASYNQANAARNLAEAILPFVEANYNVSDEREGRAYGGFSMGGMTGGAVINNYHSLFGYFGFFSGSPSSPNYAKISNEAGVNVPFVMLGNGTFEGALTNLNNVRNNFRNVGIPSETHAVRGAHDMMTAGMLFTFFAKEYLWKPLEINKAVRLALEDLKAEMSTGKYSIKSVAAAQLVVDEVEIALNWSIPESQVPTWLEKIANAKNQLVLKVTSLVTGTNSVVSIRKGRTLQLDPEWAPASVNALEIQYSSSNVSVASVSANGQIVAVKPGMAVITLKALDGSGLTTQVLVTVTM